MEPVLEVVKHYSFFIYIYIYIYLIVYLKLNFEFFGSCNSIKLDKNVEKYGM